MPNVNIFCMRVKERTHDYFRFHKVIKTFTCFISLLIFRWCCHMYCLICIVIVIGVVGST
jgi:hypothetical protein